MPFSLPVLIVIAKLRFLNSTAEIRLPHTTKAWHSLLVATETNFAHLQDNTMELNDFYFVDQETKKLTIDNEFIFMDLVKKIKPAQGELPINLLVRIKGLV